MASFKRILIANRGEIAVRIIRTAQKMGLETIAVYSEADRGAPHVRMADYAGYLGESTVEQSYLNAEKSYDGPRIFKLKLFTQAMVC